MSLHLFIPPWWWFSYIISCCKIKLGNAMKLTISMPRFCLVFLIYLVITHLTTWSFLRDTRNYETSKEIFLHSVIFTMPWPHNYKYIVFHITSSNLRIFCFQIYITISIFTSIEKGVSHELTLLRWISNCRNAFIWI